MTKPETATDIESLTNQTQFSEDSQFFDHSSSIQQKSTDDPNEVTPKPKPKWLGLLLVGGCVFLILIGVLLMIAGNRTQSKKVIEATPEPKASVQPSAFQAQLKQVQRDLEAADPTKPVVSFPQIKMEIRLDDKR
jgi:hypothetical protein